jgi:hypothetical protein
MDGVSRTEYLHGRKYLVRMAACGTEGVMAGVDPDGNPIEIFYPEKVWKDTLHSWSNKPIMNQHPGGDDMADDQTALEKQSMGFLLKPSYDNKFRTECWFDADRTQKLDPAIYKAVLNNQPIECSTGQKMAIRKEDGEHNGVPYKYVAVRINPNHLAILTKRRGAYSISKGGGINVLNEDGHSLVAVTNEASYSDIMRNLDVALRQKFMKPGYDWFGCICDVYKDGYLIYSSAGKLWRLDYEAADDGTVTLSGKPEEVQRTTVYVTVSNEEAVVGIASGKYLTQAEAEEMAKVLTKEQLIDTIIGNGGAWEETDREHLGKKNEDQLKKLLPIGAPKTTEVPVLNMAAEVKPGTYILTADQAAALSRMAAHEKQAKEEIITAVMNMEGNQFKKEWLEEQKLDVLQGLQALAVAPKKEEEVAVLNQAGGALQPKYYGAGGYIPSVQPQEIVPLPLSASRKKKETAAV